MADRLTPLPQRIENRFHRSALKIFLKKALLLAGLLSSQFFLCSSSLAELRVTAPAGFLPGVPLPVWVELTDENGNPDRNSGTAAARVYSESDSISPFQSTVRMHNGAGSTWITVQGNAAEIELIVAAGAESIRKTLTRLDESQVQVYAGTLEGDQTQWSGCVRVAQDVHAPAGHVLNIAPGAVIVFDGTDSGTDGLVLNVEGAVHSEGTQELPVVFTSSAPDLNWGQIRHANADPSWYRNTMIIKSGRAPGAGHTGTGPAFHITNSKVDFQRCLVSDSNHAGANIGKIMMAEDSELSWNGCFFARARMGPELQGTSLDCQWTWFVEMFGPDDADGLYLHDADGRPLEVRHSVIAAGDDDGLDTLNADVWVEDCLIRDWLNPNEDAKGISVFNGHVRVSRSLIVECYEGVSAKSNGPLARVDIDHCTIAAETRGVSAAYKSNAVEGNIRIATENSIVLAQEPIYSDFGSERHDVRYSNLSQPWTGEGNLSVDPEFVGAPVGVYQLRPGSPCIDAGDPLFPNDGDGSRTDIGALPFQEDAIPDFLIRLLSPETGEAFYETEGAFIDVFAYSKNAPIQGVRLLANGEPLQTLDSPPFQWTWNHPPAGSYQIRAEIENELSQTSLSPAATIQVFASGPPQPITWIPAGSVWRYWDDASPPDQDWTLPSFDDALWKQGPAEFGYGEDDEATVIDFGPDENNKRISSYYRLAFEWADESEVLEASLRLLRDDGAVVYLNGSEVIRPGMPEGPIDFQTLADDSGDYDFETFAVSPDFLRSGTNLIAVEIHQDDPDSSDVSFDLELFGLIQSDSAPLPELQWIQPVPGGNPVLESPAQLTLEIQAAPNNDALRQVDFLVDGIILATVRQPPFRYTWQSIAPGQYEIVARAVDILDRSVESAPLSLAVKNVRRTPAIASIHPLPGRALSKLDQVTISFNNPVAGLQAQHLLANGVESVSLTAVDERTFRFNLPELVPGEVRLEWKPSPEAVDAMGRRLENRQWQYTLDPGRASVVIQEIMFHPASENESEEYIELWNEGPGAVDLAGWRFDAGVDFEFGPLTLLPGDYLVVAADPDQFRSLHPAVDNVTGPWNGVLSNSHETIRLVDAEGGVVDEAAYADEGDWAVRVEGELDLGHRGWNWESEADGGGKSLELIRADFTNDYGQNWAASATAGGTPGRANSQSKPESAPLILEPRHEPLVPRSDESVIVQARVLDELPFGISVELHYRAAEEQSGPFQSQTMNDLGVQGDLLAGDGIYSARLPSHPDQTVVEFYLTAADAQGNRRQWPAPAVRADGTLGAFANLLYQVDDGPKPGEPLFRLVMTPAEWEELQAIGDGRYSASNPGESQSDAQMNATFISRDAEGTELRYLTGVRNRGHGTRNRKPNNFRVNFRSDRSWRERTALNLNGQYSWLQTFGARLALKSGVAGARSLSARLRVNGLDTTSTGSLERTYGSYAANEAMNSDWASRQFPNDSSGNLYRAIRDIDPDDFDYRGEDYTAYMNTWFKASNEARNDWTDLIGMLRVLDDPDSLDIDAVRSVIDVEQWLLHLAFMAIVDNGETGLNTGDNDDYFLYRGVEDPRFILLYYDLDTLLGEGSSSGSTQAEVFGATDMPVFDRLMHHEEIEPVYYRILHELLAGAFSKPEYDSLLAQTLGEFVPQTVLDNMIDWMDRRRDYLNSSLPSIDPVAEPAVQLLGTPRSTTPLDHVEIAVTGEELTHYRYSLDQGAWSEPISIEVPLTLMNLPDGPHRLAVAGQRTDGVWQAEDQAGVVVWEIDPEWPVVVVNEVYANSGNGQAGGPLDSDWIEIWNEGTSAASLDNLSLSDDPDEPEAFQFAAGDSLAPGEFRVIFADPNLAEPGIGMRADFALNAEGEGVYLFERTGAGERRLVDSVEFGNQLSSFSLGRMNGADWALSSPTPGSANQAAATSSGNTVRINEWLASHDSQSSPAFFELYNPNSLPAAIGQFKLTGNVLGEPRKYELPDHSFIPENGFLVFSGDGGMPLPFRLNPNQGEIGLLDRSLSVVDWILYGPQTLERSQGRCPDGGARIVELARPTPGEFNVCPPDPVEGQIVSLVPLTAEWDFDDGGNDLGTDWIQPNFDATGWKSGPALIGYETSALPEPILTDIAPLPSWITYYFRTQFEWTETAPLESLELAHIIDDGAVFYLNGIEIGQRFEMPEGPVDYLTEASSVGNADWSVQILTDAPLVAGTNTLAVEVHQTDPGSSDMVFGLELTARLRSEPASNEGLRIAEIYARSQEEDADPDLRADWAEFINVGFETVSLSGMGLTDQPGGTARWMFPDEDVLIPGERRVLRFNPNAPVSNENTGFGLNADGGFLTILLSTEEGVEVVDGVRYGVQIENYSIGVQENAPGAWTLAHPTPGLPNQLAKYINPALGSGPSLRLNEWMADPISGEDWFEIFNPMELPAALSGLWLSDDPANPRKHRVSELSFIDSRENGFALFHAGGIAGTDATRVNFRLNASGEALVLTGINGNLIDGVQFQNQSPGVSEGRQPDGGDFLTAFPDGGTPGASNGMRLDPLDADDDSMPDEWELAYSLNPADSSDAFLDLDFDGIHNAGEYTAGTDPTDPESRLQFLEMGFDQQLIQLQFLAQPGRIYAIESSPDWISRGWRTVAIVEPLEFQETISLEIPATDLNWEFFRLSVFQPNSNLR